MILAVLFVAAILVALDLLTMFFERSIDNVPTWAIILPGGVVCWKFVRGGK